MQPAGLPKAHDKAPGEIAEGFGHFTGPKHRSGQAASMSGAVASGFRSWPQALGSLRQQNFSPAVVFFLSISIPPIEGKFDLKG
jgi:hypothetical protein